MPVLLRSGGFALALGLVRLAAGRRRAGAGSRVSAYALLVVGIRLGAIAAVPDLVRPVQDVLGPSGEPHGRLVTVLVVTVTFSCSSPGPIGRTSG